jgi:hypothetical protein
MELCNGGEIYEELTLRINFKEEDVAKIME